MGKFEEFYKQHCLDHFRYDPDLNWIFEKHEDGSYIQIEVENAKKVYQHQQAKVCYLEEQVEALQKKLQMVLDVIQCGKEVRAVVIQERDDLQKRVDSAISNIEQFFDEQTQQPTQREYANFLADMLHDLKLEQAIKGGGQ